jgi:hypothetical protein
MIEGSGSVQIMTDPDGPKTYGSTTLLSYNTIFFCITLSHLFHVASPLGIDALAVFTAELGVGFTHSGGTVQLI